MTAADAADLLSVDPPESTDHAGLREFVTAACGLGLSVALMAAGHHKPPVVADFRSEVAAADRVPVRDRRGQLPRELVTTDARTAVRWIDTAIAELTPSGVSGNRAQVAVAVGVGSEQVSRLTGRRGVIPGPTADYVTIWRKPTDVVPAPLTGPTPPARSREDRRRIAPLPSAPPTPPSVLPTPRPPVVHHHRVEPGPADPWTNTVTVPENLMGDVVGLEGYWVVRLKNTLEFYRVVVAVYGSRRGYARRLDADRWADPERQYTRSECWQYDRIKSGGQWLTRIRRFGHRMTAEEFAKFGDLYGRCIRCGLLLTNPTSVARGCGDVCAEVLAAEEPDHDNALPAAATGGGVA